jgi:hypothetical protein
VVKAVPLLLPCDVIEESLRSLNGDDGWRSRAADQLTHADERARTTRERKRADHHRKTVAALGALSAALVVARASCPENSK